MPCPEIEVYPFDDELLATVQREQKAALSVYRLSQTVVVLGRGSRPEVELELAACSADGVPLLRRRGGGCAVVIDPGDVIVSLALPLPGIGGSLEHFATISGWLVRALAAAGIPGVRREGSSDLALGERKVGGACIHRSRGLLHYSAALLAAPRSELYARYLRHPPREPAYRRGRLHAEFVGRLLPAPTPDPAAAAEELAAALRRHLRLEELELPLPGDGSPPRPCVPA